MADIFEIAGRIHSTSQEKVAVTADEVLDGTKKQSQINTETYGHVESIDNALANLSPEQQEALGVAAKANNNEANLGFYVCDTAAGTAAKAITSANYVLTVGGSIKIKFKHANSAASGVTLKVGSAMAKPLYYDGTAVSVNNTWEDNETVEVYYDGTNYYANNVAGGGGDGVFDVSEKYPTSGVEGGNTYTLAGALAVLNANLPASKKKGGMSIKFVQSSDNKYIQARCMAQNFTTNTAQWQGVDETISPNNKNLVNSGTVFNAISPLGITFDKKIVINAAYSDVVLDTPIPEGIIITSFNGYSGSFSYKEIGDENFITIYAENLPHTLTKNAEIVRSNTAATIVLSFSSKREYSTIEELGTVQDNVIAVNSFAKTKDIIFSSRTQIVFNPNHSITLKAGSYYLRGTAGMFENLVLAADYTYNISGNTCLVYDTTVGDKGLKKRSLANGNVNYPKASDVILVASDATEGLSKTCLLYPYYQQDVIESQQAVIDELHNDGVIYDNIPSQQVTTNLYKDLPTSPTEAGTYIINIANITAVVKAFRLRSQGLAKDLLTNNDTTGKIGQDIEFSVSQEEISNIGTLRVIIESSQVTTNGTISIVLKSPGYDIIDIVSNMENSIASVEETVGKNIPDNIIFPVPQDIYCAVGRDMNLYYENMFGMLVGKGYMFIDSPNIVYDTSMSGGGNYDNFCNFDRQLHFKPNTAGVMTLYLNVWNEYMKQVAAKTTILHIVNPSVVSGKTVNMLVNGSSSIDMGSFQSEIKKLLEDNGATVNMVGRWASESNADNIPYNQKVANRLSENRSGGASNLFVTKANAATTKIVHPTSLTNKFYRYDSELVDGAGNHWMVWGNSTDFVELVLKSGNISTIPSSGTMTKVTGYGEDTLTYDRLIVNVPQTTNPFWDDSLNGISFASYCQKWNRPTPNVFVTLWGTNDIGGSGGNIATGLQWATDAQIATFVNRQRILVDAFTRDCPNGVVIMCPQPTGSVATGRKNSDKNGMLYSKLKVTQALMDAFADDANVIIVPVLWWFDRYYSYNIYERTLSERMNDYYGALSPAVLLDKVTDDSTHPQARGYYQMADAAFSAIVGWLANE